MSNMQSRKRAAALRHQQIRSKSTGPRTEGERPRFVADVMLGRLAKWLRIAGFDVIYSNRITDDELVALSRNEGRTLLSRDTRLLVRKTVDRFIFLESEKIQDQLAQVFKEIHAASFPEILTRCLICNDLLHDIPREQVAERVPPFVFQTQTHFKSCLNCGKLFWAGTHRQTVVRTLQSFLP
jgi:uncharacterized protein